MNDLTAPDLAIGGLVLAATVLYAAWHEYTVRNQRDANLLAALGAASFLGSAVAWFQ
jgi:hypothetical protein